MKKILVAMLLTMSAASFAQSVKLKDNEKNCDLNEPITCLFLAQNYMIGIGSTPQDKLKAAKLYQKACDSGVAFGCTFLSEMYKYGDGVHQDKFKVAELDQKACWQGGRIFSQAVLALD